MVYNATKGYKSQVQKMHSGKLSVLPPWATKVNIWWNYKEDAVMEKMYIFKYLSIQILTFKKNIYSQDFVKPV